MKLFSLGRTDLAVSSKLPTPVGLVKCRKTIIVLRTSVMVWYTWRSPWTVVFAHSVQSSNETHSLPSCCCFRFSIYIYIYKERLIGRTDSFEKYRDTYSLDQPNDILSKSMHPAFRSNRSRTTAYIRHVIVRWVVRLPDHPPRFYSPPPRESSFYLEKRAEKPTTRYHHILKIIEGGKNTDISFSSWHIVLVNLWVRTTQLS